MNDIVYLMPRDNVKRIEDYLSGMNFCDTSTALGTAVLIGGYELRKQNADAVSARQEINLQFPDDHQTILVP